MGQTHRLRQLRAHLSRLGVEALPLALRRPDLRLAPVEEGQGERQADADQGVTALLPAHVAAHREVGEARGAGEGEVRLGRLGRAHQGGEARVVVESREERVEGLR